MTLSWGAAMKSLYFTCLTMICATAGFARGGDGCLSCKVGRCADVACDSATCCKPTQTMNPLTVYHQPGPSCEVCAPPVVCSAPTLFSREIVPPVIKPCQPTPGIPVFNC